MNELINYGGVCRTAPATPGLLKKYIYICIYIYWSYDPHRSRDSVSPVCGIFQGKFIKESFPEHKETLLGKVKKQKLLLKNIFLNFFLYKIRKIVINKLEGKLVKETFPEVKENHEGKLKWLNVLSIQISRICNGESNKLA